jgi:hypothetical protein
VTPAWRRLSLPWNRFGSCAKAQRKSARHPARVAHPRYSSGIPTGSLVAGVNARLVAKAVNEFLERARRRVRGKDILKISRHPGHEQVSTTLDVYGHLIKGTNAEVAKAIEGMLK